MDPRPGPTMVGFQDLVGVGIGLVSKKLTVKAMGKVETTPI